MSLNLPNALAFLRVFLAPLMFWLLLSVNSFSGVHISWMNYFAALVFVIASVTDFFDGFIARAWDQKTKLGAVIDPLADKMLTLGAFLGLMMIDRASPWAVYLILVREFFITGFRVVMAGAGGEGAPARAGAGAVAAGKFHHEGKTHTGADRLNKTCFGHIRGKGAQPVQRL